MAGFPKVRMLELELFQCLNRQLGYAGRLGVVAIELPLPARGSQTVKQTVTMRSGSVLLAFNRSCPLYSVLAVMGARGSRRRPTHVQILLFRFRDFSSVKDRWQRSSLLVVQQREPLGRLHSFMLCGPGHFTSYLTSSSTTRIAKRCRLISSPSRRCLISRRQEQSLVCSWRVPDIWRDISRGRLFPFGMSHQPL